ncbi:MAG TPA: long-chain-fatty-acid--CoA ligase [Steroidobacteraceae bacterium]|jgi:fatty-acyl-CoA synthase|nr:long-chain-fatty-acid--CoA ligase [Steroidobacteraceae bacterium]
MQGLMQAWPLTVDRILDHASRWHGKREVVTRSIAGPIVRTSYAQLHERARRLSGALSALAVRRGERVATLAWNTARHMETWYAVMGIGAICHTLNPRLHPEQLAYIINHAEDRVIFVDATFLPLLEALLAACPTVEHVILMGDGADLPPARIKRLMAYEPLLDSHSPAAWGGFDENTAAGLCYTSGTTGAPKGVLYSHRANFIHTFLTLQHDIIGLSARDVVLPIVPMFHANAWGLAFSAPAAGAKLVMPGARMDGAAIHELIETEGVTFSAAVPTVWQMLLEHLIATRATLTTLKRVVIGGAACPESLIRGFHERFGVEVVHGWGMTEMSPLGTVGSPTAEFAPLSFESQLPQRLKQGRVPLGVDMKLVDDAGLPVAHDGAAYGRLLVRGPAVAAAYFKRDDAILDADGWFDTGDIGTIDAHGCMQVTDRAKDLIKSGGEWISSIEIENIAAGHPKTALAAVIGRPHPKWGERPLLLLRLKDGETATAAEMLGFLESRVAKWWLPDEVLFVDRIPLGPTGKVDKKALRAVYGAGAGAPPGG